MRHILCGLLVLGVWGVADAAGSVLANIDNAGARGAGPAVQTDAAHQAENAYSIGLICYAGGDLTNAEKFFAQALQWDPRMDKAAHALDQVKNERELAK